MNSFERWVHSAIGDYPFLRIPAVFLYQRLFSAFPSKSYTAYETKVRPGYFFGFHDKQPWSHDGGKLLAHKFDTRLSIDKIEKSSIQVGYFNDANLDNYVSLGSTSAWNWQQGSSLQWVGNKEEVAYNEIVNDRCLSKIVNLNTGNISELPHHLSAVSHSGKYGLSFSFSRFGQGMPGYGYKYTSLARRNEIMPRSLLLVDIQTHAYKEIVSIDDVISIKHHSSMEDAFHFFSHCQFSPDDGRLAFYHRWLHPSGHLETRLYSSDLSGENLYLYDGSDFSHIAWCGNNEILSFAKARQGHHGYYLFSDGRQSCRLIGKDILDSDGHPQCSKDGNYILTDTYPDRLRNQYLKMFDMRAEEEIILAKLRIPFQYRLERRCDFHPRLSRDERLISFDSAHSGVRSLCVMKNPYGMS